MINTFNENSLHKTLKDIYAYRYEGLTEQQFDKFICDIVCKNNLIIEIQTSNLSKLTEKISCLLNTHKVILVYPMPILTYIKSFDINGNHKCTRKSPKKKNIYYIFGELFTLYKLLDNKNFTLIILPIIETKEKHYTKEPVQTFNKSRRFRKDWLITNKILTEMKDEILITKLSDLLAFLPKDLPEFFSSKELSKTEVGINANKMLWVLKKAELIEFVKKENRFDYYQIKTKS